PHRGRGRARDALEPRRAPAVPHARARQRPQLGPRGDLLPAVSDPRVTVVVAAFNGERFLRETLESVVAQDFDSYEVVFVDDGSEDRTGEIAQSFPVRYVRQENRGLPAARNAGLALARGDLIAFLDDDDVLPPTKLGAQARYLDEHPEVGCVLGRQEWI